MRGYFGIGVFHPKHEVNIGTLWRHAQLYGASFVFTIGRRYKKQASDTGHVSRHVPLYHHLTFEDFYNSLPHGCQLICVEQSAYAKPLVEFKHPTSCAYLLGAEDHGIPEKVLSGWPNIEIPAPQSWSMNVAAAGTLVMYDRFVKDYTSPGSRVAAMTGGR